MTQDPDLPGFEQLLPPASESAQQWIQFAVDAGFIVATISTVVLMATGHIQRVWQAIMGALRAMRHERNALDFNRVRQATDMLLAEWQKEFGAMRAMLLCAVDSEFIQPTRPQRISVVTSQEGSGVPSVFGRFQDEPADPAYQDLLRRVMEAHRDSEQCVFVLAETTKDGWLKDYYRETGVVCSVVFYIRMTGFAESLYVTINFGEPLRATPDSDGVPITQPHDEETAQKHITRAKALAEHPERIRRMKRHMKALWGRY